MALESRPLGQSLFWGDCIMRIIIMVFSLLACSTMGSQLRAQALVTPYGNPTSDNPVTSSLQKDGSQWLVNLFYDSPSNFSAELVTAGPNSFADWALTNALQAMNDGIILPGGMHTDWEIIEYHALRGRFTLERFEPWADDQPGFSQGSLRPVRKEPLPGEGGANFGLSFAPDGNDIGDMQGMPIHWLQLGYSNHKDRGDIFASFVFQDPMTQWLYWIDSVPVLSDSPFYDTVGWANSTDLVDTPNWPLDTDGR